MGEVDRVCSRVESELQGEYGAGIFQGREVFHFHAGDRPARVEFEPMGETRVVVDLKGRSPGVLLIYPEGFWSPVAKFFGAQDLRVGDAPFDALYMVKARPEGVATALFHPSRRGEVVRAIRSIGVFPGMRIELSPESLRIRVSEPLLRRSSLSRLLEASILLTARILERPDGEEVLSAVPVPVAVDGGICLVCGAELEGPLARCRECGTPHHRECWDYAGGCSTYACGSRVAAP